MLLNFFLEGTHTHCVNVAVLCVSVRLCFPFLTTLLRTRPSNSSSQCLCERGNFWRRIPFFHGWRGRVSSWDVCLPVCSCVCVCHGLWGHVWGGSSARYRTGCQEEEQSGSKEEPTREELSTDGEEWRQGYRQRREGSDTTVNRINEPGGNCTLTREEGRGCRSIDR